jgi:hypothetical protein
VVSNRISEDAVDGGHAETCAAIIRKSPQAMPLAGGLLSIRSFASKRAGGMKKAGTGDASASPEASNDLR